MIAAWAFLLVLHTLSAQGLGPEYRFVHAQTGTAMMVHDMDGDGDGDVLHATVLGLIWHERISESEYRVGGHLGLVGEVDQLLRVDLDQDGLIDIVFPDRTMGAIRWLRALGVGSWAPIAELVPGLVQPHQVDVADLNGDGAPDLVYAMGAASVSWSPNQGNGTFASPVELRPLDPVVSDLDKFDRHFALADIDGDGDMDMAVARHSPAWLRNDGSGSFTEELLGLTDRFEDVVLTDLDGDGDPDWVMCRGSDEAQVVLLRNQGGGDFGPPEGLVTVPGTGRCGGLRVGDLNGDGAPDLVFQTRSVGLSRQVGQLMNNGSGSLLPPTWVPWSASGNFDHVDIGMPTAGGARILFTSNYDRRVCGEVDPDITHVLSGVPMPLYAVAADLIGNAAPEAIVVGVPDMFHPTDMGLPPLRMGFFRNPGNGELHTSADEVFRSGGRINGAYPVDLDGDGDLEIIAQWVDRYTMTTRHFIVFTDQGNGEFDSTGVVGSSFLMNDPRDPVIPIIRDIDGDGDLDLVYKSFYYTNVVKGNGDGTFASQVAMEPPAPIMIPKSMALCDVDGDGAPDYIWAVVQSGAPGPVYWGANDGNGSASTAELLGTCPLLLVEELEYPLGSPAIQGVDLNSDGAEDLLFFNGTRMVIWYNENGTMVPGPEMDCDAHAYTIGDLDDNGQPDIIAIRTDREIVAWFNAGGGVFGPLEVLADSTINSGTKSIALADMDQDGDLDVLTCSPLGAAAWLGNDLYLPMALGDEPLPRTSLFLVPNPTNGPVRIMLDEDLASATSVELLDASGRLLRTYPTRGALQVQLDLAGLQAGVHLVRVLNGHRTLAAARIVLN